MNFGCLDPAVAHTAIVYMSPHNDLPHLYGSQQQLEQALCSCKLDLLLCGTIKCFVFMLRSLRNESN